MSNLPASLLWIIVQYLPAHKHLFAALRAIPALRKFVEDHVTTDEQLYRWFGESIPVDLTSGGFAVVPLIPAGGVWAAIARCCRLCDVCHKFYPSGTIDAVFWVLAHYKTCLHPNLFAVRDEALSVALRAAGAPRIGDRDMFIRGGAWVPPGPFPDAWTVYGACAMASRNCGLTPEAIEAAQRSAKELSVARAEALKTAQATRAAIEAKLVAKAKKNKAKAKDLQKRKEQAQKARCDQLKDALKEFFPGALRYDVIDVAIHK
jgi:hypothetical protein